MYQNEYAAQTEEDGTQQLCGTVENVTFHNEENGFTVMAVTNEEDGELVPVVGIFAAPAPGEALAMRGKYVQHAAYGKQFEAETCAYMMPQDTDDILKYLASGVLPGIGPATARKIVQKFGTDALEVVARQPEKLAAVKGMTPQRANDASTHFLKLFGTREAIAALSQIGLSVAEATTLYKHYGKHTLDIIDENPYALCSYPLYASFARADAVARNSGGEPDSRRTRAALLYTLRHNMQNGHMCLPKEKLLQTASSYFRISPEETEAELSAACEDGDAHVAAYSGREYIYLPEPYRAEVSAAQHIRMMNAIPAPPMPGVEKAITMREHQLGLQYAPMQKAAITQALSSRAMVITGGPGTGKTTAVNAIISLYEQDAERVLLAAPTGRAAKRLAELTGRKAATIHRMLEVDYSPGEETLRFKRNNQNPLKCDVMIVDEMSMVDAFLFESLLDALRPGCRLIMVGDTDQLPSVGPGSVLKGIIDSGVVPVVALNEIFRQAAQSLIVSNAHKIVEGQSPEKGGKKDDFFIIRTYGKACQDLVCQLVSSRLPASYGFSPTQDIQVLCPGRKGLLGTETLNIELQNVLNPPAPDKPEIKRMGLVLRLGDKVMQTRNNYDIPFVKTDGEPGAGAYNGDIGVIEGLNPKAGTLTVLCEDRHVDYNMDNIHELELAYAITIHKSQGSEFEAVIMPLSDVAPRLQYRHLLYTGVTRAKQLCIIAGEEAILEQMVRAGRRGTRYSCFSDLLQDEGLI